MTLSTPILAVEDEESDAFLLKRALKQVDSTHQLIVVRDGAEAVDYLSGTGQYQDRSHYPVPGLILLDINMPRMTGFEVLSWIKDQPAPPAAPVVMFSSSALSDDMERARELGASDYVVKPSSYPELMQTVRQITDRWLD